MHCERKLLLAETTSSSQDKRTTTQHRYVPEYSARICIRTKIVIRMKRNSGVVSTLVACQTRRNLLIDPEFTADVVYAQA